MPNMIDSYLSISAPSEAEYTEKRSRFLAFAFPVKTAEEVKALVTQYEKEYYDARHVCYAYMLGHEREVFRTVDNGEPSGTAGKPILGQINSANLTDILIIVVRYFGGVKLGTSGLIQAYREAALLAIQNADIQEYTIDDRIDVIFEYPLMNQIMRVVKEEEPRVLGQDFDNNCILHLQMRRGLVPQLLERLSLIRGVTTKVLSILSAVLVMISCSGKEESASFFSRDVSIGVVDAPAKKALTKAARRAHIDNQNDSIPSDSIVNVLDACYRWDREFTASTPLKDNDGNPVELHMLITLNEPRGNHYFGGIVLYVDESTFVEAELEGIAEGNHITIYYIESDANTTGDLFSDHEKLVTFTIENGEYTASWYAPMHQFVNESTIIAIN